MIRSAKEERRISILYKYLPPPGATKYAKQNLRSILEFGKIRLTGNVEVNDPFDTFPSFSGSLNDEAVDNVLGRIKAGPICSDPEVEKARQALITEWEASLNCPTLRAAFCSEQLELMRGFFERAPDTASFTSLTELRDSMLMWSHYAFNHQGVCIGWNSKATPFPGDSFKVAYSKKRPCVPISDFAQPTREVGLQTTRNLLLTKNNDWGYEKEWRYMGADIKQQRAMSVGELVPFDRTAIAEVIFGTRCSGETKQFVSDQVADLQHISLYQARLSKEEYALCFEAAALK